MRLLLVAALVVSSVSFAQTSPGAKDTKRQKTEIIFDENDLINGEGTAPNGTLIDSIKKPVFGNMIRVRENFADKLRDSVNDLH